MAPLLVARQMKHYLASYFATHFPQFTKLLMEHADRALRQSFQFSMPWDMESTWESHTFTGAIDWDFQMADDPEWTFMLSRSGFVLHLAQASILTQNEAYAQKAIWYVHDFLGQAHYSAEREKTSWRSLDASMRLMNWIDAMRLLNQVNTPEFLHGVRMHVDYLASQENAFLLFSNWGIIGNTGLFKGSLLLQDAKLASLAQERIKESLAYQILPDGMQWEQSPLYHAEVLSALLSMVQTAKQHGWSLDSSIIDKAKQMAIFMLGSMKPNRHQFLQSDSDDTDIRDVLTRAAYLLGENQLSVGCFPVLEPYSCFFATEDQIESFPKRVKQVPPFLSFGGMESGNIYLRTGWTEHDSCCHFRCGQLGGGHGHADLLHVDIVAHGHDVLVDSGRYTYCETEERKILKQSSSHSTIVVDGQDATVYENTWSYAKRALCGSRMFKDFGNWSYGQASSHGYLMDRKDPVLIEREVLQIGPSLLLIHDTFTTSFPHTYSWYFHFSNRGSIAEESNAIHFSSPDVVSTLYFETGMETALTSTLYAPHYNDLQIKPSVRLSRDAEGQNSALFVLHSEPIGQQQPCIIEELPVYGTRSERCYTEQEARAWRIQCGLDDPIEILFRYKETMELLNAGTLKTYARACVHQGNRTELFRL